MRTQPGFTLRAITPDERRSDAMQRRIMLSAAFGAAVRVGAAGRVGDAAGMPLVIAAISLRLPRSTWETNALADLERAERVHLHHVEPRGVVGLPEILSVRSGHAGIVDQDVDRLLGSSSASSATLRRSPTTSAWIETIG